MVGQAKAIDFSPNSPTDNQHLVAQLKQLGNCKLPARFSLRLLAVNFLSMLVLFDEGKYVQQSSHSTCNSTADRYTLLVLLSLPQANFHCHKSKTEATLTPAVALKKVEKCSVLLVHQSSAMEILASKIIILRTVPLSSSSVCSAF